MDSSLYLLLSHIAVAKTSLIPLLDLVESFLCFRERFAQLVFLRGDASRSC